MTAICAANVARRSRRRASATSRPIRPKRRTPRPFDRRRATSSTQPGIEPAPSMPPLTFSRAARRQRISEHPLEHLPRRRRPQERHERVGRRPRRARPSTARRTTAAAAARRAGGSSPAARRAARAPPTSARPARSRARRAPPRAPPCSTPASARAARARASRSHSSAIAREPEPGSRSSHGRPASSSTATQRRFASGSSGAVTSTISLTANASPHEPVVVRHAAGDRDVGPVVEQARRTPRARLPMCRSMSSSGCASRNARMSGGTTWSPADVTALMRSVARPPSAASRAARPPSLEQPEHVRRVRRERRARARSAAARGRRARAASRRPRARARRPPPTPTAA